MVGSCEVVDRSFDYRKLILHRPIQLKIDQPKWHISNQTLPLSGFHGLFHLYGGSRPQKFWDRTRGPGWGTSDDPGP